MNGPAKNRLHGYEAGWLTMLVRMGIASEQEAHAAMSRVAQRAVERMESRRAKRRRRPRGRDEA